MYKVLICQNELSGYNVPVYNTIAEKYDLTVAFYLKDKSNIDCNFKKYRFETSHIGPFTIIKNARAIFKKYDIVCVLPNLRIPSYFIQPFLPRKNKVVSWSIGFRASYSIPYRVNRKHTLLDSLYQSFLSHCDASIFYMEKAKEFWTGTSLDMSKTFVAPNTTDVLPVKFDDTKKDIFLFVGTLYKGKGLDLLLDSYNQAYKSLGNINQLHIVGDGSERVSLEKYVADNGLSGQVIFHGAIYDEKRLADIFSRSLLCISPTQGGLSVPKSMGYGVPFVTSLDSITGGEIYHIDSGYNGIMYKNNEELTPILVDAAKNPQKYIEMGVNAKTYYDNHATIKHMAQGAINAFEFALNI